jgi:co-chaperonin GroES (HSP10)
MNENDENGEMQTPLVARGKHVLFEKSTPDATALKSKLILSTDVLNPELIYGHVINSGDLCKTDWKCSDCYIYAYKMNAIRISHGNKEYYVVKEEDILASINE